MASRERHFVQLLRRPIALVALLALVPACRRDKQKPTTTKTDRQIEEAIERELTWSPFVDANQVNVHVLAGRASLTGAVETERERRAATDNAFEGGALSVDNRLSVKDSVLARPPH